MDIEFSEWPSLREMFESGTLKKVRQLAVEVHTPEMDKLEKPNSKCTWSRWDTLATMMQILYDIENTGFAIYHSRPNYRIDFISQFTQQERLCCYNLHLVNLKHPKNGWKDAPPNLKNIKLKQQPQKKANY